MSEPLKYLVTILGLFILCPSVKSQTVEDSLLERITYYQEVDSFELYYKSINNLRKLFITAKQYHCLYTIQDGYDVKPKSEKDSVLLRKYLGLYASGIRKYLGNIKLSNQYYLKASFMSPDQIDFDSFVWYVEKTIANNYARLNEYDKALQYNLLALRALKKKNSEKQSQVYADISNIYFWQGDTTKAIESCLKGIKLAERFNNKEGLVSNSTKLASYYLELNEFENYDRYLNKAYSILDKIESKKKDREIRLLELRSNFYIKKENYRSAIALYKQVLSENQKKNGLLIDRRKGKLCAKIAECYLTLSQYDSCYLYIERGMRCLYTDIEQLLPAKELHQFQENTIGELYFLLSSYFEKKYEDTNEQIYLDSLLDALEVSIKNNDILYRDLVFEGSKLKSITYNRKMIALGVWALFEKYRQDSKAVSANKIKEYFNRSKNIFLSENRNKVWSTLRSPELKIRIQQLEEELRSLTLVKNENDSINLIYADKYSELDKIFINTLTNNAEIQNNYIEYLMTDKGIFFISNIGGFQFSFVDKDVFDPSQINDVINNIKDQEDEEKLKEKLSNISHHILPDNVSEQDHLIIIPDGILCIFPFDLLVLENKYLINQLPISYRNNRMGEEDFQELDIDTVFFVSPEYKEEPNDSLAKIDRSSAYRLKYVNTEKQQVQTIFPNTTVNKGKYISNVIKESYNSDLFHFAGHAKAEEDDAYLIFNQKDSILRISTKQLSHWSNNFQLVTLSACETGIGPNQKGEGIKSLANTFLKNGTKNIVYSLWTVNDKSTNEIITALYQNMNKNGLSQALRNAKLQYLESAPPDQMHPYYWAGFAFQGPLKKHHHTKHNFLFVIAVGIVLIFLLNFNR